MNNIKTTKQKKIINIFSCVIFIILLFSLTNTSNASIFQDTQNNLHCILKNNYFRSTNFGETWKEFTLQSTFETNGIIQERSNGILSFFWVKDKKLYEKESKNKGSDFSEPRQILQDFSPLSFFIKIINGTSHIVYQRENTIFHRFSINNEKKFSEDQILSSFPTIEGWSFFADENVLRINIVSNKKIYQIESIDQGNTFTSPEQIYYSNNDITEIASSLFVFWIEKKANTCKILFLEGKNTEPTKIYESTETLSDLQVKATSQSIIISFNENKFSKKIPMITRLFTNGQIINQPKEATNSPYEDGKFVDCLTKENKLIVFLTSDDNTLKKEEFGNYPPEVKTTLPEDGFITNSNKILFKFLGSDIDQDNLLFEIKANKYKNLNPDKPLTFKELTSEAKLEFPDEEGDYYLETSVTDGIAKRDSKEITKIIIDKTPPEIIITKPLHNQITTNSEIETSFQTSEESYIKLNGKDYYLKKGDKLSTLIMLKEGENKIELTAMDKAGNVTTESLYVTYNANAPVILITKPTPMSWFKSGSTIFLEISISDNNNDVEDLPTISINSKEVSAFLINDTSQNKINGFIELPENLKEGQTLLNLTVKDKNENTGTNQITFGIDNKPPSLIKKSIYADYDKISIPIDESGSGLDSTSIRLKVYQGSLEVSGKIEIKNSLIEFTPSTKLTKESYTLQYSFSDNAGNLASPESFNIMLTPDTKIFATTNTSYSFQITNLQNGPNPFNHDKDQAIIIKYILSSYPANIEFYLFSITGKLLYKTSFLATNTTEHINFRGVDNYGNYLSPGVYPYILQAKDNYGTKDLKRGKIIIF